MARWLVCVQRRHVNAADAGKLGGVWCEATLLKHAAVGGAMHTFTASQGRQTLPQPGRVHHRVCGSRSALSAMVKASKRESIWAETAVATSSLVTTTQAAALEAPRRGG